MNSRSHFHSWITGFFAGLAHLAIRHPKTALLIAALAVLVAAPGVGRLQLRTDGHALVDATAPEIRHDQQVREAFGLEDQLVVLIRSTHEHGIFNPDTLQRVRELTAALRALPELNPANVLSLATEPSFRMRPGTLINETLLEPPLQTRAELDQLREDLRRIELYTGTLVAADGRSTVILAGVPAAADRVRLYQRVRAVVAGTTGPDQVLITGAPAAEALLGLHILEDLGVPVRWLGVSTRGGTAEAGAASGLRARIARSLGLVPLAVGVMLLVFLAAFRNVTAALLPLPTIAATLLFAFGLLGWCGVPVYLTLAVMPVLLTALAVTDQIHILDRYLSRWREQPGRPGAELLRETMDELTAPIVGTSLTTAIGFAAFGFSTLPPVRALGLFTALGVMFAMVLSLTAVPALLVLLPRSWLVSARAESRPAGTWFADGLGRVAVAVARRRWLAPAVVLALAALAVPGWRQLTVQDSWIEGFAPDSEFRRATEVVNTQFMGMHLLLLVCDAPESRAGTLSPGAVSGTRVVLPGDVVADPALLLGSPLTLMAAGETNRAGGPPVWRTHIEMAARTAEGIVAQTPRDGVAAAARAAGPLNYEVVVRSHFRPELIEALGGLAAFLRERSHLGVGGVIGPAEYQLTTRFMTRPNDPTARTLPRDATETKLMWDYYRVARAPQRLRQILDPNAWTSVTTVFLRGANYQDTARLLADVRDYEQTHFAPRGWRLSVAGDVAVSQTLIGDIVSTQLRSLGWALAGILAAAMLLAGSARGGLLCVLPSALAVAFNFALMGWLGIPLGVATSMFAGMTLGIGVDFAIHLLAAWRRVRAQAVTPGAAIQRALEETGPAVAINTLAVTLGFGVLLLSQVPANARLGLLAGLGLVSSLLATLLLLPAVLAGRRSRPAEQPAQNV